MTTVYNAVSIDGTSDGDSDGQVAYRHKIASGALSAATGNQVQVTFRSGSSSPSASPAVTGAWIGRAASAGSINFTGNQVQLKFAGSSTFNITAADQTITSDVMTLGENFDNTKDYVVSFRINPGATCNLTNGAISNVDCQFLGGSSAGEEALTTASGGYTAQAGTGQLVRNIFITAAAGGGFAVPQQQFKLDKFKTPTRSMGPKAGFMQVKAFPQPTATTVQQQIIEILQVRQRSSYW